MKNPSSRAHSAKAYQTGSLGEGPFMNKGNGALVPRESACLENVLARLNQVKATGAGKWTALCSGHHDKNPSLSIGQAEDGKVLLHCWTGCTVHQITAAIGLTVSDLFPGEKKPLRGPSKAAIMHEQIVYNIGVNTILGGRLLTAEDQARFDLAKKRLGAKS